MTKSPGGGSIFQGNERFSIRERLGEGGMGVVYRAYDRELDTEVALKTLRALDAAAIYRFKREFRSLADISHRNLVSLHELISEQGAWFFTMELVDGVDFSSWVRPLSGHAPTGHGLDDWSLTTKVHGTETDLDIGDNGRGEASQLPHGARARSSEPLSAPGALPAAQAELARRTLPRPVEDGRRFDEARLRDALRQLAEGVQKLHENGRYHRDIKPSNVLVTSESRVVLLDFGLVTMLAEDSGDPETLSNHVVGTVGYMAPEQGAGLPVTGASDWYSVGVMLFEALTGQRPFVGSPFDVLAAKQNLDPREPADLVADVPRDLNDLCADLIRRDPRKRPDGITVLGRLSSATDPALIPAPLISIGALARVDPSLDATPRFGSRATPQRLVGREQHLQALFDAYRATRRERAILVYVSGGSGMGKSVLVRRFLDDLLERESALVLAGRCYERESVPFKAFDDVIDGLCRHLARLSSSEATALLPREIGYLARVFPVLLRVRAVREAAADVVDAPDLHELRRRAFLSLRELLERLVAKRPVIVHVDDLQWGDLDSAALLERLVSPPDPPAILFIGSYRAEDAEANAPLRALLSAPKEAKVEVRRISVEPLSDVEARALVEELLPEAARARVEPEAIVREADGNPFFVHELVRHAEVSAEAGVGAGHSGEIAFDDVLASRLGRLADASRELLEAICVSGRPIAPGVALKAANGIPASNLIVLFTERLIRTRVLGEEEALEAYHDRIREGLVRRLDPGVLASCHRRLAVALEASGQPDPEAMVEHLLGYGDVGRAGHFAEIAAQQAVETLAFDRAARLYRIAIAPRNPSDPALSNLYESLAWALVNAGRGREAAEAYQHAADMVGDPMLRLDLRRAAAEQLLRSGHVDEGLAVLELVLGAAGMALASTPKRTIASLLLRRGRIRLRGMGFEERPESDIPKEELSRIDLLWSVAMGLSMVDVARGADFQSRHVLLALKAGEPYRVARALAMEACYSATGGGSTQARTARLVRETSDLAARLDVPHAVGLARYAEGVAAFLEGRFLDARNAAAKAEHIFRERCIGVAWEVASARIFHLASVGFIGDLRALCRAVRQNLEEAEERGDRYAAANLRTGPANLAWLIEGDPEGALRQLDETMASWSQRGFHLQHYYDLIARGAIDLYCGSGRRAHRRMLERWSDLERSLLLSFQFVRIDALSMRARTALQAAREGEPDRAALLEAAVKAAQRIEREKMPWSNPIAWMLFADAASQRGEREDAARLYAQATAGFRETGMALYETAARWRHGELEGGEEGRGLTEGARRWMEAQGVSSPGRLIAMLAP